MRSDIPLALDILPSLWKSILGLPLDESDLRDADILTYNYIRRLSEVLESLRFTTRQLDDASSKQRIFL